MLLFFFFFLNYPFLLSPVPSVQLRGSFLEDENLDLTLPNDFLSSQALVQ